jgi:hypothetical protein
MRLYDESDEEVKSVSQGSEAAQPSTGSLEPPEVIPRSFSPWSDMSSTNSESEETSVETPESSTSTLDSVKAEVEQIIDHLTRIAVAIRKTGSNFRYQKADRLFKPEAHEELRRHLNILVLARGSEAGREHWAVNANYLTPVQERLIRANLRRRNRFLYAQRHAQKLAVDTSKASSQFSMTQFENPVLVPNAKHSEDDIKMIPEASDTIEKEEPSPHSIVLSATTASAVETQIEEVPLRMPTPSRMAKTNITSTAARLKYPRPPRMREGLRYFQCPCCCQVLPELFREETQWRLVL